MALNVGLESPLTRVNAVNEARHDKRRSPDEMQTTEAAGFLPGNHPGKATEQGGGWIYKTRHEMPREAEGG